jgi:hypothetical protein
MPDRAPTPRPLTAPFGVSAGGLGVPTAAVRIGARAHLPTRWHEVASASIPCKPASSAGSSLESNAIKRRLDASVRTHIKPGAPVHERCNAARAVAHGRRAAGRLGARGLRSRARGRSSASAKAGCSARRLAVCPAPPLPCPCSLGPLVPWSLCLWFRRFVEYLYNTANRRRAVLLAPTVRH